MDEAAAEADDMTIDDLREIQRARSGSTIELAESEPVDIFASIFPARGAYACRGGCPMRLELPGVCDRCAVKVAREERDRRVRAWSSKALPERYRDASWSSLPKLKRDDASGRPRVEATQERLDQIRTALETHRRVVFIGPPGCGKTTIAVAHLRAAAERDPSARVRFIPAEDLLREETPEGGPTPLALALSAEVLVVDDLGVELHQAPVGSGLLAQRAGAASKLIGDRFDRQLPLVVTTGLDQKAIQAMYGDRIARRLFEGAAMIRLGAEAKRTAA